MIRRRNLLLAAVPGAAAALGAARAQARGGDLVYVTQGTPQTLDAILSADQGTRNINLHLYEMLVSRDERGSPVPDLAAGFQRSDDGLSYIFTLRQGVHFHNGQEMTADDVKASFERYKLIGLDRAALQLVSAVEATGKYLVTVRLSQRMPSFIEAISSPRAPFVIIPKEEAEKPAGKIAPIGTGPFQLVEYVPDSHAKLKRFEGYSPNTAYSGTDGFAGRKLVNVDTVTFRFVPEANARVASLEVGEAHFIEQIPNRAAQRLKNNDAIRIVTLMPWSIEALILNAGDGPTAKLGVRRAIQAALDVEQILTIATDGVFRLDHGFNYPESAYWAGDVGAKLYNQKNPDLARQLLKEAGYNGEEVVALTNSEEQQCNPEGLVLTEQLRAIGMNARVATSDTPTQFARAQKPTGWNIYVGSFGLAPWLGPYGLPNFYTGENNTQHHRDPELDTAFNDLKTKDTLKERQEAVARFQARLYDQVYWVKLGDYGLLQAVRSSLQGFKPARIPRAWGVSLQS